MKIGKTETNLDISLKTAIRSQEKELGGFIRVLQGEYNLAMVDPLFIGIFQPIKDKMTHK